MTLAVVAGFTWGTIAAGIGGGTVRTTWENNWDCRSSTPVRLERGDEVDARLWEIAENLHRAELTTLERTEHVAAWIELHEQRRTNGQPSQIETAALADGRKAGPQHQEGGVNAAARELGIERNEAHRAVKRTEAIPEDVRETIKADLPAVADNGRELEALATAAPEQQREAVAITVFEYVAEARRQWGDRR